jgi:mannitol/fructose-specific phosphotransferase system IIA component (Ntr-type)
MGSRTHPFAVPAHLPAVEPMNLSQLLRAPAIRLDLKVASKEDLIRQTVDLLDAEGILTDKDGVVHALLERERVMSTGIGGGVAIPHAQSPGVRELAVSFVRVAGDLPFDALDGKPVRLVFMIVGPEERGGFIRVLARISRLLYTGDLQRELLAAEAPEKVVEIIRREEEKLRL